MAGGPSEKPVVKNYPTFPLNTHQNLSKNNYNNSQLDTL